MPSRSRSQLAPGPSPSRDRVVARVQVLDQRSQSSLRVSTLERVDDQLMLDTDLGEHARRPGRVEPRDAHEPPKLPQQSVQDRQARSIDDLQVKLLVEIEKGVVLTVSRCPALPHDQKSQVVDVVI